MLWGECVRICYCWCCVRVAYSMRIRSVLQGPPGQSMACVLHAKAEPTCTGKQTTDSRNFC